jgi:plasmid maintenance system antidote protein VapI
VNKVKKLIAAGASVAEAIRVALGRSVAQFAEEKKLNRAAFSAHINGSVRATDETIAALIEEFGGTEKEWRHMLWKAGEPNPAQKAAV